MSQNKCNQCSTPAVWDIKGIYLCINCYATLQQANYLQFAQLASTYNAVLEDFYETAGLPITGGKVQIPMPTTINAGETTFNNIRVNDSVVGSINTGNVQKLDVSVSAMRAENRENLANAIQQLTEAILNTSDLEPDSKDSALECLSFLSDQAITPEAERKTTVGKTIIPTLENILLKSERIAKLWSKVKSLFEMLFI